MATDAQSLLTESECYLCFGTEGMLDLMELALLRQLRLNQNPEADTSPQTLLNDAKCYACFDNLDLLELALLDQLSFE